MRSSYRKLVFGLWLGTAGLLSSALAGAQQPGGPPPDGPPPFGPPPVPGSQFGGPPPFGGPGRLGMRGEVTLAQVPVDALKALLKLSNDQTSEVEKIVQRARESRRQSAGGAGRMQGRGSGAGPNGFGGPPAGPPSFGGPDVPVPQGGPPMPPPGEFGPPAGEFGLPPGGPDGRAGGRMQGMRGSGGPMAAMDKKTSNDIEAILTADQRKKTAIVLKAMRALRDARIPLQLVDRLDLTTRQVNRLAAGAGEHWNAAELRKVLTAKQQERIEPFLQNGPPGAPDGPMGPGGRGPGSRGPGGPGGPGFPPPGGPGGPDGPDGPGGPGNSEGAHP